MGFGNLGVKEAVGQSKNFIGTNPESIETKKITNNKLTGKKTANSASGTKRGGAPSKMFYPIARGGNNITGDTLLIKCIEYKPPGTGIKGDTVVYTAKTSGKFNGDDYQPGSILKNKQGEYKTDLINRRLDNQGASETTQKSKIKYYVELPIPQDVNDTNTVTWGDDTMNIFQLAGLAAAQNMLGKKEGFAEKKNAFIQGLLTGKDAITENADPLLTEAIISAATGKAIGALGGNISINSALGRAQGKIINSNLELLFDGVNLRSFPFTMNFSPRSQKEGEMVKKIIRSFKQSMAAKKGNNSKGGKDTGVPVSGQGGVFLRAPDVFSLEYKKDGTKHPFLNSFKNCALTGMSVNYTNAGTYATYDNGTPVSITMSLTFKELNPIYSEDYDEALEGVGF